MLFTGIHTVDGPAPAHRFLPDLIQLVWAAVGPGKVFDLTRPIGQASEGYKAMDERRATKVLLTLRHLMLSACRCRRGTGRGPSRGGADEADRPPVCISGSGQLWSNQRLKTRSASSRWVACRSQ